MQFEIYRVDSKDARIREAITAMHWKCYAASDNPYHPPQDGAWWIAYADDGEHAGFAGIVPSVQIEHGGYLCRAAVLPKFRGYKLQCRLIRVRLAYARRQGWHTVVTDTRQNPASANSLIRCGFKVFAPAYTWGFTDAVYWRRTL